MQTFIIYHNNCFDGFGAAWVAKQALADRENVVLLPASYGDTPPEVGIGDEVYILDFSYPRDILRGMNFLSSKMVVLDHHHTAQANCEGLDFCTFDMARSGAGLTWDYFHPGKPRPRLIDYIEDRDLWNFKLPHSKEIFEWLASYPMDFEKWHELSTLLESEAGFGLAISEGAAILRYTTQKVEQACKEAQMVDLAGYKNIPVVNVPYFMGSDVGHRLLELYPEAPFAAYYLVKANSEQQWGLRGRSSDDFDVSEVAKQYGGGGHKKASGFIMGRNTRG